MYSASQSYEIEPSSPNWDGKPTAEQKRVQRTMRKAYPNKRPYIPVFTDIRNKRPYIPVLTDIRNTMGFEFSYIENRSEDYELERKEVEAYGRKFKSVSTSVSSDSGEIEVHSVPMKSYFELAKTWLNMEKIRKKNKLVINNEFLGGGGMHVHVDLPQYEKIESSLKFLDKLFRVFYSRPYLNWIFNEPIDDINANSDKIRNLSDYIKRSVSFNDFVEKKCGMVLNEARLEFRIFDQPQSLKQLFMIVNFLDKFLSNFYSTIPYPAPVAKSKCKISKDRCLEDFKKTLMYIDADYSFEEYMEEFGQNLDTRFEWKNSYLN